MRIVTLILLLLGLFVSTVVGAAEKHIVKLEDKQFIFQDKAVEQIVIKKGDTVLFTNTDTIDYDIASSSSAKSFKAGVLKPGASKTITFDKPGSVEVECAIHTEMFLEVVVR